MANAINKTLDILEYVCGKKEGPVTPSELAASLGINAPTCVRILGELGARGYVVQVSRRKGYVPGPATIGMADNGCAYARIARAAAEVTREIGTRINRLVLVSTFHAGRKFVLNHFDGRNASPFILKSSYNDLYYTVSGRMLLAHLQPNELAEYVENNPLSAGLWRGVNSMRRLKQELAKIRARDSYHLVDEDANQCVAIPLAIRSLPFCTLSSSIREKTGVRELTRLLLDGAGRISETLRTRRIVAV